MSRPILRKLVGLTLLLAFVGAFAVHAPAQTKKQKEKAEKLINEGAGAVNQKSYQAALTKLNEALEVLPNSGAGHFHKARAHYFLNEFDTSVAEFDLALKNGYRPMDIYRNRWAAHEKLKNYDAALADIKNVLAADQSNVEFLRAAADLEYEKGSYQEAAETYLKLVAKAPNAGDIYYRIALARSKAGDIEGQASAAESAISKNTQFLADSLILLGTARLAQKRVPEALDAYSRALRSKPEKLESYRRLAELYRSQNQIEEGIKILEDGRRLNATNGDIYADLSLFYSLVENNTEAVAKGRSATQLVPNSAVAHTNLCRAYFQSGKAELAISSCNSALRLSPEDGEALFYLGRAHNELARTSNDPKKAADAERFYHRAVTSLTAATAAKPEDPEGWYMLGNAYADLQQSANAIEAYKKVLELNPKLTRANFNIGIIQLNGNNKAGALEQYNVLLTTDKVLAEKLKALIDRL